MTPLLICAGYLGIHFTAYALAGRHFAALQTERGIFAYHAFSYALALFAVGLTGFMQPSDDSLVLALLMVGCHGIYSLSFLEVWSLTQGSYSLQLLAQIAQAGRAVSPADLTGARAIGAQKQQDRTDALRQLRLICPSGELSGFGRVVASLLRGILWLSNGRPLN